MKATTHPANTECQVCVMPYTPSSSRQIKCPNPSCQFTACSECYKQFITDHPDIQARCMDPSCKTTFSFLFIHHNFTKSFANKTYSNQLKEIYFQKEQARFPETQELIILKDKHNHRQKILENQSDQTSELFYKFYKEIQSYGCYFDPEEEPSFIIDEEHCYDLAEHYIEYGTLPTGTETSIPTISTKPKQYKHQYHGKCPSTDCRGFITNEYICGICHIQVCHDCLTQVDTSSTHTCNPTTVETVKAISSETKPCPTCQVPIYKIDGCSQIWCVQCHTAFCWNTGNIETQIHNPHYYEWMRTQKNNTNTIFNQDVDQPPRLIRHFGGSTPVRIHKILNDKFTQLKYRIAYLKEEPSIIHQQISDTQLETFIDIYYKLCQLVIHYMNVVPDEINLQEATATLRENYLRGVLPLDELKSMIFDTYNKREYTDTFNRIINASFVEPVKTIFENYLYELTNNPQDDIQITITKFNNLLKNALEETEISINSIESVYTNKIYRFVIDPKNTMRFQPQKPNQPVVTDLL